MFGDMALLCRLGSESESVHFTSAQEEADAIDWNVSIPETFPLPETQIFNQSTPSKGTAETRPSTSSDSHFQEIPETFSLPETLDNDNADNSG